MIKSPLPEPVILTACGGTGGPPKTLKDCVRHFTPAWFAVIMGTGAIDILFHNYPYDSASRTFKIFTYIFFFLNLSLFIVFNILTAARYILFPDIWSLMIRHPVQSLYIGTYPMGAATLINVAVGLLYEQYGFGHRAFLYFLWAMWWLDVVLSFLCAFPLVHVMKTRQDHALSRMTAVWILPVVTLIVASSSGGILAQPLLQISPYYALITLTLSAVMLGIGLSLAMMLLTLYLLRLVVHGVPQGLSVISVFIPLGPMGQGGYSLILLGQGFRSVFPLENSSVILSSPNTGEIIDVVCACTALVLWSLATMWMLYALFAVGEAMWPGNRKDVTFKLPVWGLIFPNGVYANLTIQLYRTFDLSSFRVWGAIYGAVTLFLWSLVFARSLTMLRNGQIFESPCIEEIDMARKTPKQMSEASSVYQTQMSRSQMDIPMQNVDSKSGNASATAWAGGQGSGASSTTNMRPSQSL